MRLERTSIEGSRVPRQPNTSPRIPLRCPISSNVGFCAKRAYQVSIKLMSHSHPSDRIPHGLSLLQSRDHVSREGRGVGVTKNPDDKYIHEYVQKNILIDFFQKSLKVRECYFYHSGAAGPGVRGKLPTFVGTISWKNVYQ